MDSCDVLVVGGGPAGSTCAGRLKQCGVDVLLLDKEAFPRRKPCAGWITPAVLETLGIDAGEYRQGRVLQEISSFRTGLINSASVVTHYGVTVSYGILRSEFDQYLIQRSSVRRQLGEPVKTVSREGVWWLVNGCIRARLLVGAGGHFCPVARRLGAKVGSEEVVVAQVAESFLNPEEARACGVRPDTPELFFCRDMKGYGWLFRKGNVLNAGLGRQDTDHLAHHVKNFRTFLEQQRGLPLHLTSGWQGHGYRLYGGAARRRCVSDGALLIGDAAGVAHPLSGEGILPSIESALLAAETILAAKGDYRSDQLAPYAARLDLLLGSTNSRIPPSSVVSRFSRLVAAGLLSNSLFARHVVLDSWFLHAGRKAFHPE